MTNEPKQYVDFSNASEPPKTISYEQEPQTPLTETSREQSEGEDPAFSPEISEDERLFTRQVGINSLGGG